VTLPATWVILIGSSRSRSPSGFVTDPSAWSSGSGVRVSATRYTTGAAAAALAHQRQRGDGSDPVGVNSSTKPRQAMPATAGL
jgi:hypothetical protein